MKVINSKVKNGNGRFIIIFLAASIFAGIGVFWGINLRGGERVSAAPPETQAFSGTYTPTACGPRHAFAVPAGKTSIVVVASATVPANDIVLNFFSEGATASPNDDLVISSNDTGTSPETATYQPVGGIPAGTYKAEVCPFDEASQVTPPPIQYNGTFTTDDAPISGTPTPTATATPTPHPPSNPTRTSGNITYGPATVADLQRTEAEPLNFIDRNGNIWASGPYGASTNQSFIQRSTDGGNQYNVVSPVGLRPDPPPGGGDTDVILDDQANAYFVDLEALANLGCAVSNDNGNNWRKQPACVTNTGVDRQWFAIDNGANQSIGAAGAADNTVFLAQRQTPTGSYIYSSPGSTGSSDTTGGLIYQNASSGLTAVNSGAPCGQMRFDPVKRNLYLPCTQGNRIQITKGRVNVGQRTGINFTTVQTPASPGGGNTSDLFAMVTTDAAGNLYAAWVDESDHNIYYSYSTDEGESWGPAVKINSGQSVSNIFVWTQGGAAGNFVVTWLGTTDPRDSDAMTSWFSNPALADDSKWYVNAALITNAAGGSPNIEQNRVTSKPSHYGQICAAGTACALDPDSDRVMAEYHAVYLEANGGMRFIYNDTTSQHHGAHLFDIRQLTGPTAKGGTINRLAPVNPITDPAGDAQTPHYSPTGAGENLPQLDFTGFRISQPNANTLRFHLQMNNLASLAPPPGKTNAFWMARFQALSNADTPNAEAYRVFHVGAESVNGAAPTFFIGSPTLTGPPSGCTGTTPGTCKVLQYPAEITATGQREGNTLCVDMPLSAFGATRPINGTTLYSVTAFSGGRNSNVADIHLESDATPAFDYTLGSTGSSACNAPPTAAAAAIRGRVTDRNGKSLRGVTVTLQDASGAVVETARTNGRGFYRFSEIRTGGSYIVRPARKGYVFNPSNQVFNLLEDLESVNFVGTSENALRRDRRRQRAAKLRAAKTLRGDFVRSAR